MKRGFAWKEWRNSQDLSKRPMKITLPGPMTIADTVVDQYYNNNKVLGCVLSGILNKEIKDLVSAGCKYFQASTIPREGLPSQKDVGACHFFLLNILKGAAKDFPLWTC